MANGVVGIDLIGNTGAGRDEATAYAARLGGRFARVSNDIPQCQLLLPFGITPLYRVKNQDWNDDDAHRHIPNAEVWVDKLHAEAPPGCDLYLINEPGDEDPEVLGKWLQRCVKRLRAINAGLPMNLKRHGVAPNWGYGRPTPQTWDALAPYIREYVADGHYLAAHEGYDAMFDTFTKAYPHVIGRMLKPKQAFGGTWIITEFASSLDAYHGWECWQSDTATADKWEEAFKWYAANGFYVIPFTYHRWQECFRYSHNDVIKNRLIKVNKEFPVMSNPTTPAPTENGIRGVIVRFPPGVPYRNLRTQPNASAADVGDLLVNEEIVAYTAAMQGDWCYVEREFDSIRGWALFTGVEFVPALLPPTGVTLTPEQVALLRSALTVAGDAVAVATGVLDEAEGTPGTGGGF